MSTQSDLHQTDPLQKACATLLAVSASRSRYYHWLSLGFYPPEAELIAGLRSGGMVNELHEAAAWLGKDRNLLEPALQRLADLRGASGEQLQSVFERLFGRGIERVSAGEAAYRWRDATDLLQGAASLNKDLARLYSQFGLVPLEGMQDHVAVELEFLSYLCWRESEHWAAGTPLSARDLRQQQHNFINDHLGRWLPEFALRVRQRAPDSFYSQLAALAETWLTLELGSGFLGAK